MDELEQLRDMQTRFLSEMASSTTSVLASLSRGGHETEGAHLFERLRTAIHAVGSDGVSSSGPQPTDRTMEAAPTSTPTKAEAIVPPPRLGGKLPPLKKEAERGGANP